MINMFLVQIGAVPKPSAVGRFLDVESGGLGQFLNLILNVMVVAGGIYALFNFVLAGYMFFSASDDPKKAEAAWAKIWQTAIGLLFIAGSLLLAAVFSWLIFGDSATILNPTLPTINSLTE